MGEIKEIKLSDLDESFFKDLRDGNFILVIGAGFSYKVPNKAGGNIPIGDDFAKITKERFKDESSIDYRSAAQVWRTKLSEDPDLISEFKSYFLVDESKFDFKLYSSIFIPKWHNIYSLNFDNVLDKAQSASPFRKLTPFSYPLDTSGDYIPDIFYLHGRIEACVNIDEDIVFTPESYLRFNSLINTLYNVLYGDVNTLKKKILILGSQFKEDIILHKFFKELPADKSVTIYHLDIKNYNKHVLDFTKRNTTFVDLNVTDSYRGTEVFLNFLNEYKHRIRNIELPGAITIDKGFEDSLIDTQAFSQSQYYSSKQDDNCQWYGILKGFDVIREGYYDIKNAVTESFVYSSSNKVAAVVYGNGGSGKSTLLRRLAFDLSLETDIIILWIKENHLEDFVSESLSFIQADLDHRYIVFLEDWYRLDDINIEYGKILLNRAQSINNIRLVIGDRDISGKDYILNLIKRSNIYKLLESENKIILDKLIANYPSWKQAYEDLVRKNPNTYGSSLFMILFAISGIHEQRIDVSEVDITDFENTVKRIAKYDLKKIAKHCPGLGKALHYWACANSTYKIYISYATFLKIADFYNGNKEITACYKNWKSDSEILRSLKLYINVSPNENLSARFHNLDLVQFNQDILADSVLSKVELENWEPYDDIQKINLLKVITDEGDDLSASVFLRMMLKNESQVFLNDKDRKAYIDKLFYDHHNRYFHYLNSLLGIHITPPELYRYIEILSKEKLFHPKLWLDYFKIADRTKRQEAAVRILEDPNVTSIQQDIVVAAFNQPGNEHEKQVAARKILEDPNVTSNQQDIVVAAFNVLGNEHEKQESARKILVDPNVLSIIHHIVVAAFNQPGNEHEKQEAARKILEDPNVTSIQEDVVVAAFNQPGNEDEKQEAARKILEDPNVTSIIHPIVVAAFNQPGNVREKQEAARKILEDPNVTSFQQDIVVAAFNQPGNEDEKQEAARKILEDPNLSSIIHPIVVAVFNLPGNENEKQEAARKILEDPNIVSIQRDIVLSSFKQAGNDNEKLDASKRLLLMPDWKEKDKLCIAAAFKEFSNVTEIPEYVKLKVSEIINDFFADKKDPHNFRRYSMLMATPFHNIVIWKTKSKYIINHWESIPRTLVANVLYSYRSHPDEILGLCKEILNKWKEEINRPIFLLYGEPHKGDHIKIALGHPNLKLLSKITAGEIVSAKIDASAEVPEYLYKIAEDIIEGIYPEWNTKEDHESNSKKAK